MKAVAIAVGLGILVVGGLSSSAWSQSIQIGPGGVRVGPDRSERMDRRGRRWDRDRAESCRVVVERSRNRRGERVTRRTRVCR